MEIAVIGAGAIGGLVAGYLKLKGEDVRLAGHPDASGRIKEKGLQISGVRGNFDIKIDAPEKLSDKPGLVILAVKTQDIAEALKNNLKFIKQAVILTAENGVRADDIVSRYIPKENIISSIVMFGATNLEPGKIIHNFEGSWIISRAFSKNDNKVIKIANLLNKIFPTIVAEDLKGMKYLKIFVNANNCISAILGLSMQEAFSDIGVSKISMGIWREGLDVVKRCGIELVSLPDFPLERLSKLTSLPILEGARVFSGIMSGLSKEPLYGSVLQSIKRGRPSEIDYINGEFVNLARTNKFSAPLNERLVAMVHEVEKNKRFFSKDELLDSTKELLN